MKEQFTIRYYFNETPHLKRKTDNLFPVQLVVYDRNIKKRTFILTGFYFKNKSEFESVYIRGTSNATKKKMNDYLDEVTELAETIIPFSTNVFKSKLNSGFAVGESVNTYYINKINDLKDSGNFGTASNYECSINSIKEFWNKKEDIQFTDITVQFLKKYEKWTLDNERTATTVGIYLRPLRSLFNDALIKNNKLAYPFHSRANESGYKIPSSKPANKALTSSDLKKIFESTALGPDEEQAKDFFIFAYLSNGMNMMDVAKFQYKSIKGNTFTFIREKTKNTTKEKQQIEVLLSDHQKQIIEKYGNKLKSSYVFPIINKSMTGEQQRTAVQAFTRSINKYLKHYARRIGVTDEISTNWARHSFATILDSNNVSLEFIRQNLGHTSLATTQNYLSSFSSKDKEKNTSILTDF